MADVKSLMGRGHDHKKSGFGVSGGVSSRVRKGCVIVSMVIRKGCVIVSMVIRKGCVIVSMVITDSNESVYNIIHVYLLSNVCAIKPQVNAYCN